MVVGGGSHAWQTRGSCGLWPPFRLPPSSVDLRCVRLCPRWSESVWIELMGQAQAFYEPHPIDVIDRFLLTSFQVRRPHAAERRHPAGRERMGFPTLQTLQDPILLAALGVLFSPRV
jgi:hypothetical protein